MVADKVLILRRLLPSFSDLGVSRQRGYWFLLVLDRVVNHAVLVSPSKVLRARIEVLHDRCLNFGSPLPDRLGRLTLFAFLNRVRFIAVVKHRRHESGSRSSRRLVPSIMGIVALWDGLEIGEPIGLILG